MTVITKREHERDREIETNPALDTCSYCGLDIHEQSWFRDDEGFTFCDGDCAGFFREKVEAGERL